MDEVKFGIIGSGFIAKTHAISVQKYLEQGVLVGIAGGSRAQNLARELGIREYQDNSALIASDDIDAVIITSPHEFHHDQAILCAKNGKHVLLEKPMATSVEKCQKIHQAFAQNNLKLMIAFTQRFRKSNYLAYKVIQSGELGQIRMIQDWQLLAGGLSNLPQWQQKPENLGVLFGYGIHNIDRLRWFLQSEVESISAQNLRYDSGIETTTMAILRFKNGTLVNLWTGLDLIKPGFPGRTFRAQIVGEKGLLDVDGYGEVKKSINGKDWETLFIQPPVDMKGDGIYAEARMNSFNAQNQEFIDSIIEKREPAITGIDGIKSVEMALAIYQAANENKVINL
jgi:predicted dehydrogenase